MVDLFQDYTSGRRRSIALCILKMLSHTMNYASSAPWVSSVLALTLLPQVSSKGYSEALYAQSLFGSHFGAPAFNASFDYVIVGGGTAGLTLANRLGSNGSNTVAVIEAGDFSEFVDSNYSQVPAYASYFIGSEPVFKNPSIDWYQYTTPQKVSLTTPMHQSS